MQPLTDSALNTSHELANRYGVSHDAVMTLFQAVQRGNGSMAQFYHNDLGGPGQWMQGGMTMVGDMFNHGLKAKVDGLCNELSRLLASGPFAPVAAVTAPGMATTTEFPPVSVNHGNWWPGDLGYPASAGGQNDVRYAYFPASHRLAVELYGRVTVYDTLDHRIGGVSQQQGGGMSLTFTSQYGNVDLARLPVVSS